jgi:hypothetical protein
MDGFLRLILRIIILLMGAGVLELMGMGIQALYLMGVSEGHVEAELGGPQTYAHLLVDLTMALVDMVEEEVAVAVQSLISLLVPEAAVGEIITQQQLLLVVQVLPVL